MTDRDYIAKFETKQGLDFHGWADDRIAGFGSIYFFDIVDIRNDIDRDIPKGVILDYLYEGMDNGKMPDYIDWVKLRNKGTSIGAHPHKVSGRKVCPVFDPIENITYPTIKDAAISKGIKYKVLYAQLKGKRTNNSGLELLDYGQAKKT